MEKRSARILKYILEHTQEGRYVVLGVGDMLAELKIPDTASNRSAAVEDVKAFVECDYIACKYYDESDICAAAMSEGRAWLAADGKAAAVRKKLELRTVVQGIVTLVCALIGAFAGTLLAGLV